MNMRKLVAVALTVMTLSGCASGPVPIGKDTYMSSKIGAWSWSSAAGLRAELYREAYATCAKQGKEVQSLNEAGVNGSLQNFAQADLKFRCVDAK